MRALQEQFLRDIYGPQVPKDPAIALYRELTHFSLQETLDSLYPTTKMAFEKFSTDRNWSDLEEEFLRIYPPKDLCLNRAFEKIPEWLPAGEWIRELADYEWRRFLARSGRDPQSEDWVNPTLVLGCYEYSIPSWYEDAEGGAELCEPKQDSSFVAVFREISSESLQVLELQPAAVELLSEWLEGSTPEDSVQSLSDQLHQPVFQVRSMMEPFLKAFLQEGVLLRLP